MNKKLKALFALISTATLAAGLALVVPSAAQAAQASYYPSGAQANVSLDTVTNGGWTLCWSETYDGSSNMNDVLAGTDDHSAAPCNGTQTLMTGWNNSDPNNLITLAAAPTADVFTETPLSDDNGTPYPKLADGWNSYPWSPGNIHTNPHEVNGTYWYYTPGISMGFTPTRDLSQYPGDAIWGDGTQSLRLSWHMYDGSQPDSVNGGFSLGDNVGLNDSTDFTRAIFTSNVQAVTGSGLDVSVYSLDNGDIPERRAYTPCVGAWTHVDNIDADFDSQFGSVVAGCQTEFVLVHYKGFVTFPTSGSYAFQALADDGFWMSLDDTPVITDDWTPKGRGGNIYADVPVIGGHAYAIDAWYFEQGGFANATLTYSPDNGTTWSTVPSSFYTRSVPGLNASVYTFDPANPPERQAYTPCDGAWTHVDDISVNFDLQFGGLVANCQNDYVLVHYTGSITFPDSGTYAFQALADDGFWMSLDSTPLITDDWVIKPQSGNIYPDVSIVGGHAYAFDAWFYEYGGGAGIDLTYSPDNGSTWTTVPASYFASAAVGPVAVAPTPTVSTVAPDSGSTVGGTSLTITGTSFVTGATVTVGGAACTDVAFVSATSLTCTSPAGNAGASDVVVTNPDGKKVTKTGAFTYQTPHVTPTITLITPSTGAMVGSRWITITGTGFASGATVTIGGAACSPAIFLSATSLNCLNPGGSAGAKDVVVTNPDDSSVTLVGGYTYQALSVTSKYLATQSKKFKLSFAAVGKLLKVAQKPKGSLKVIVAASSRTVCKVSGKYLVGLNKVGTCQFTFKSLDSRGRLVTTKSGKFKTR